MARNVSDEHKRFQQIVNKDLNPKLFGAKDPATGIDYDGITKLQRETAIAHQAVYVNKTKIEKNESEAVAARKEYIKAVNDAINATNLTDPQKANVRTAVTALNSSAADETTAWANFKSSPDVSLLDPALTDVMQDYYSRYRKAEIAVDNSKTAFDKSVQELAKQKNKYDEIYPELKEMKDLATALGADGPFKFIFKKGKPLDQALKANEIQDQDIYKVLSKVASPIKKAFEESNHGAQKHLMELLRRENLEGAQLKRLQTKERIFGVKGKRYETSGIIAWLSPIFEALGLSAFFKAYFDNPLVKMQKNWAEEDKKVAEGLFGKIKSAPDEALQEAKQAYATRKENTKQLSDQAEQLGLGKIEDWKTTLGGQTIDEIADDLYRTAHGMPAGAPTGTGRVDHRPYQPVL